MPRVKNPPVPHSNKFVKQAKELRLKLFKQKCKYARLKKKYKTLLRILENSHVKE
jgi:hypothetical protein